MLKPSALRRWARRVVDVLLATLAATMVLAVVLVRLVPALGGTTLIVGGPSMTPAVPLGSAVVVFPADPDRLVVGDVVSIRVGPDQAIFTHRINRVVVRDGEPWFRAHWRADFRHFPG